MKTYFFNVETVGLTEYKIKSKNLKSALQQLLEKLLINNESFKVYRDYYCTSVKTIPASLYDEFFTGYSF